MGTLRSWLAFVVVGGCLTDMAASCGRPEAADLGSLAPSPEPLPVTEWPTLTTSVPEPEGARCARGGVKIGTGADMNGNGVLERLEIVTISYACNPR